MVVVTGDAGDGGVRADLIDQAAEGAIRVVLHAGGSLGVTCHWSFIRSRPEPFGHLRLWAIAAVRCRVKPAFLAAPAVYHVNNNVDICPDIWFQSFIRKGDKAVLRGTVWR